jgi:predicted ATPase
LVTIVGIGGVGKTRTATHVGELVVDRWIDGVWFVDLSTVADSSGVVPAIATALAIAESHTRPLRDSLVAHLRSKQLLLIVDNCEHVIDETATVLTAFLRECPDVRILATSREPLRVGNESVYRMPSLSSDSAVALFEERARAADASFQMNGTVAPLVQDICGRLDRLPLALELAAARIRTLSVRELASRLDERFALLAGGERLAAPRQRTMRAMVDWSYDLLDASERKLFARLAVFPGTFAFDAVSATCAGDGIEPTRVFEVLASLVDKSLVVVEAADETTRYRLLETVREYALEKLRESGEYPATTYRHATAYLALAEEIDRLWYTEADHDWFPRLERERDNFRAALDCTQPLPDASTFLRLVAALARMWYSLQPVEGARQIRAATELVDPTTDSATVARLAIAESELHESRVQFRSAREAAERAKVRFTDLGDELGYARALHLTGASLVGIGSFEEGERLLAESLTIARGLDAPRLVGMALGDIGGARNRRGDADGARDAYAEALAYHRSHGFERQAASIAGNLAEVEFGSGQTEAALRYARSTLDGHLALGNQRAVAIDLFNMAAYLVALDRFEEARTAAVESLPTSRELGARMFVAVTLQHLAAIMALDPAVDDDAARSRRQRAQCLFGFVDERFAEFGSVREYTERQEYERVNAVLRASLGDEECERLAARGRGWSEDRAVAEATEP